MAKKTRPPKTPCLIVCVAGAVLSSGTSQAPASTMTSVDQAYAVLPKDLLREHPTLRKMLRENKIKSLTESYVASMSRAKVARLRAVLVECRPNAPASTGPPDVWCPADCGDLVKCLFPRGKIHARGVACNHIYVDIYNLKAFERLVGRSPDIHCSFGARLSGTLINWAVSLKSKHWKSILVSLLQAGANVNTFDSDGCTPLFRAIKSRNVKMVKLLLRYGACINMACGETSVLEESYLCGPDPDRPFTVFKYILERCFSHPSQLRDSKSGLCKLLEHVLEETSGADAITIDWQSEFLCQHLMKILVLHKLPKFDFLDSRLMSAINDSVPDSLRKEYKRELKRGKQEKIGLMEVSVYELLLMSDKKVARLFKNRDAASILSGKNRTGPRYEFYGGILLRRLEEGVDRSARRKREIASAPIARGFSGKKAPGFPSKALNLCSSNPNEKAARRVKRHLPQIKDDISTKHIKFEAEEQC